MSSYIEKIISGEQKAIIKFYHDYSPRILKYLKAKLSKNEDSQEILNDIFLQAIDSLPLLKKEENLQAWLYKIAHNKIVDFYRKRKIKFILLSQIPFLNLIDKEIHQPEFVYEKNRMKEKINNSIYSLSKKYQSILHLHYEENLGVKEIAKKLNLSFKATESLLFRARQSFKKAYENSN